MEKTSLVYPILTCQRCGKRLPAAEFDGHNWLWHRGAPTPSAPPLPPLEPLPAPKPAAPCLVTSPELLLPQQDLLALSSALPQLVLVTEALQKEYEREASETLDARWRQLANAEARQLRLVASILHEPTFRWKVYLQAVDEVCRAAPEDCPALYLAHQRWLSRARPFTKYLGAVGALSDATERANIARVMMEHHVNPEKSTGTP